MPKVKQIEKLKHPNSRKTKAIIRHLTKQSKRQKNKLSANVKLNLLGEKINWFKDNIDCTLNIYTHSQTEEIILKYLGRFDSELEQIKLKHSIGNRRNRQHASREDIIKMTLKREVEEYNTCGLEIPNLLDSTQVKLLKEWNGQLRFVPNFQLKRFSKNSSKDKKNLGNDQDMVIEQSTCPLVNT